MYLWLWDPGLGNLALGYLLNEQVLELTSNWRLINHHITKSMGEHLHVSSNLLPTLSAPDTRDHSWTSPVSRAAWPEPGTKRELSSYPGNIREPSQQQAKGEKPSAPCYSKHLCTTALPPSPPSDLSQRLHLLAGRLLLRRAALELGLGQLYLGLQLVQLGDDLVTLAHDELVLAVHRVPLLLVLLRLLGGFRLCGPQLRQLWLQQLHLPLQVLVLRRGLVQLVVNGLKPGGEGQSGRGGWRPALRCWTVKREDSRAVILHTPKREKSWRTSAPGPRLFLSLLQMLEVARRTSRPLLYEKKTEFFLSSMVKLHYFKK